MKKQLRLASIVAGVAIIAAACSGPSASTPASTAPSAAAPSGSEAPSGSAAAARPRRRRHPVALVRLGRWRDRRPQHGPRQGPADNPELNIEVIEQPFDQIFLKWRTDVAAGGGADMFIAPNDDLGKDAREESILNLDEFLNGNPALEGYQQVAVDGSKVDGSFYMVPESLKAVALWYDKSKVTTVPADSAALLAAVKDGSVKLGINQGVYHQFGWSGAFGGTLMDDTRQVHRRRWRLRRGLRLPQGAQGRRRDVQHGRQRAQGRVPDRRDQRDHRRPVADRRLPDRTRREPRRRADPGWADRCRQPLHRDRRLVHQSRTSNPSRPSSRSTPRLR